MQIVRPELHNAEVGSAEIVVDAQPVSVIEIIGAGEANFRATPSNQVNAVLLEKVRLELHAEIYRVGETIADGGDGHSARGGRKKN